MNGPRIHVVDTDPATLGAAASLLAGLGHSPETWQSGEQFLARANPLAGESILLAAELGTMDGLGVLGRLHAWGVTAPVIVMTDAIDRALEEEYLKRGAAWLLDKPFGLADLRRALTIAETAAARLACHRAGLAAGRSIEG